MTELVFWKIGEQVSLRDAFGRALVYLGSTRNDFVLFDADVAGGTGAKPFVQAFPQKVIQFGIAEQNMMAAAGGFADTGLIPLVTTFAAFGTMRAHEQFRTAVAYPGRNVKLCCSHLGIDVGPDGATAQMLEDLATIRAIPNVVVVVPADANQMLQTLPAILDHPGPVYMRIGRSPAPVITPKDSSFVIGKATRLRDGTDVSLVATGALVARALVAAEELAKDGITARVINLSTIKPLDKGELLAAARETGAIVTAEDHNVFGGMGSAVAEFLVENYPVPMSFVGVRDRFGKSGEPEELAQLFGLTASDILKAAKDVIQRKTPCQ
ncbi:MAG: transketolase family protein [Trichloromonadaceae bacterium]